MSAELPQNLESRYEILNPIGSGGMSVVYAANDRQLGVRVALKLMKRDMAGGEEAERRRVRFLREAQALQMVSHPNVVRIHDAGTVGDQAYVSMELIEGASLRDWLREGPRPLHQLVEVFLAAARGLKAAHEAGLVHRDFKPANVLVGSDGRVAVTDFGLVRLGQRLGSMATTAREPGAIDGPMAALGIPLTVPGAVLGTPGYMSPEQIQGQAADERADQFGFCVTMYEGLYREKPFIAEATDLPPDIALAMEMIEGKVRPPPAGSKVPDHLRQVLLRGLRPRPDQRYPSMAELIAALEAAAPPSRTALWKGVLAGALLGATLVGALLLIRGSGRGPLCMEARRVLEASIQKNAAQAEQRRLAGGAAAELWQEVGRLLAADAAEAASIHRSTCLVAASPGAEVARARLACARHGLEARGSEGLGAESEAPVLSARRALALLAGLEPIAGCAEDPGGGTLPPVPEDMGQQWLASWSESAGHSARGAAWRAFVRRQGPQGGGELSAYLAQVPGSAQALRVLDATGLLYAALGRDAEAERVLSRALELRERQGAPPGEVALSALHSALSSAPAQSLKLAERAVELLGRHSPGSAEHLRAQVLLAEAALHAGSPERAAEALQRVLDAPGVDVQTLARARASLGVAELERGAGPSAQTQLDRALELAAAAHAPPEELARIRVALAQALLSAPEPSAGDRQRARGLLSAAQAELGASEHGKSVTRLLERLGER